MPWKPADKYGIPCKEDMENALQAIKQLELEIDGEVCLADLLDPYLGRVLNDLGELYAWIAPIRRIPFEILAHIIVMSAEDVWWFPSLAVRVCRLWREVALATPRAWNFINLRSMPPLGVASRFIERSGQCLLHVAVPISPYGDREEGYATIVARITNRIECLVLTGTSVSLLFHTYPRLTRLSITNPLTPIPLEYLTVTSFPNLRYINGYFSARYSRVSSTPVSTPPPPIECLIVTTGQDPEWIKAIRAFSKTLKALHITIGNKGVLPAYPSLELPKVVDLTIRSKVTRIHPWKFVASTQALKTYSTIEGDAVYSSDVDVASVTHLRCWKTISLLPYTKLRQVHICGDNTIMRRTLKFIDQLCGDYGTCVDLEAIVLGSRVSLDIRHITKRLEKRNECTGAGLKILREGHADGIWRGNIFEAVGF
jgi:hypothetical protein